MGILRHIFSRRRPEPTRRTPPAPPRAVPSVVLAPHSGMFPGLTPAYIYDDAEPPPRGIDCGSTPEPVAAEPPTSSYEAPTYSPPADTSYSPDPSPPCGDASSGSF